VADSAGEEVGDPIVGDRLRVLSAREEEGPQAAVGGDEGGIERPVEAPRREQCFGCPQVVLRLTKVALGLRLACTLRPGCARPAAELVEHPLVGEPKSVPELVVHRPSHLIAEFGHVVAPRLERALVEDDRPREVARRVHVRERWPLVHPKRVVGGDEAPLRHQLVVRVVLDPHLEAIQVPLELRGELGQGVLHQPLEPVPTHLHGHGPNPTGGVAGSLSARSGGRGSGGDTAPLYNAAEVVL